MTPNRPAPRGPERTRARIFYAGIAILVVGLLAAALVFVFAADDDRAQLASQIAGNRMYQHNLQLMGGRFGAYMAQLGEWFDGLWHGRALAATIAVTAALCAAGCFVVSDLVATRPPGERRDGEPMP